MHEAESAKGSHQLLLRTVTLSFQIFDGSCRQALLLGAQRQPLIPTHDNWCAITTIRASTRGAGSTQPTHCTSPAAHRLALERISNFWSTLFIILVAYLEPFIIVGGCLCRFLLHSHEKQAEVVGGKASSQVSTTSHALRHIASAPFHNAPRIGLGESGSRRLVGNRRR